MKRTNKMGMFPRFDVGDLLWAVQREVNEEWVIKRERVIGVEITDVVSDKEYVYTYITEQDHPEWFVFDNAVEAVECLAELNTFEENAGIKLKVKLNPLSNISHDYIENLDKVNRLVNKFMLERYIKHYE